MAWTDAETQRVIAIETVLNQVQIAIKNLASLAQLNKHIQIKQQQLDSLTQRVASLESQIQTLQNSLE